MYSPAFFFTLDMMQLSSTILKVESHFMQFYLIHCYFSDDILGFAGWFTVDFNGSVQTPAPRRVTLSTGPEAGYTHWGQQVCTDLDVNRNFWIFHDRLLETYCFYD